MHVMLSPTPSTITDTGKFACELRAGEVQRLARARHVGDHEVQRRARAAEDSIVVRAAQRGDRGRDEARGVGEQVAGSAWWRSLAPRSSSCVRMSRCAGRPRWSGSGRSSSRPGCRTCPSAPRCAPTPAPSPPAAPSAARRARAATRARRSRTAPTTTSLTVMPSSFLIALTVSSESEPNAKRRCGRCGPLKRVRGGRAGRDLEDRRGPRPSGAARCGDRARDRRHAGERVRARQVGEVGQRGRQRAQRRSGWRGSADQPAAEHLELARDALAGRLAPRAAGSRGPRGSGRAGRRGSRCPRRRRRPSGGPW